MSWINFSKVMLLVSVVLLVVASCSEDDNGNGPMEVTSRDFTVILANISQA